MTNTKPFTVVGLVLITAGLIFFLPFYLIEVKPGVADYKYYNHDLCYISQVTNRTYECTDITHRSCGCGDALACSVFVDLHVNGTCCSDSQCCSKHQRSCHSANGIKHCSTRCVSHSYKIATLTWGYCYDMTIYYNIQSYNMSNRTDVVHCPFNNLDCVRKTVEDFAIGNKECYVDQRNINVKWSKPHYPYGWWVGAAFGLILMFTGVVFIMIDLYKCGVQWCDEHVEKENGIIIVHY